MKHIKTASPAETSMRKLYATATTDTPIVAEEQHLKGLRRIVELTRQMDLLKLDISTEIGALMGYMQGHAALTDTNGRVLVTWSNSGEKKVVDYDGLILEYNIPPDRIAAHTTTKPGSRVFTVANE